MRWATDGAKIRTVDDGWVWLFDLVEHWNGECLGWHVCKIGDRFAAWEPLAQAVAAIIAGAVAFFVVRFLRKRAGGKSCDSGCG